MTVWEARVLPTATSPGEAHRDMRREKEREKERQIKSERESGRKRQRYSAKKKAGAKTARLRRKGAREEQHNGCGFHHSEGCWLRVGEWEASSPMVLAAAMLCLLA